MFGQDEFGGNLRHAWRNGSQWQFSTVFRQTDPVHNQFLMPNMVLLSNKVVFVGQLRHDVLDADLSILGTELSLAYLEFFPPGYSDLVLPTLAITSPAPNTRLLTNPAMVRGTAADNQGIASVWVRLNSDDWTLASGTTNWSASVSLQAGTNILSAYAVDLVGNRSVTNAINVLSSNPFRLGFTSWPPLATKELSLTLQVPGEMAGHIEISSDLAHWTTLTNFDGAAATFRFTDPTTLNSQQRFYRAVIP